MNSNTTATDIPDMERALVLQGGGSLGAYEAGAYKALYEWLSERDEKVWKGKKSTFDIVAGTSIGAMNAAVLVSYVVEKGTYEGSADRLVDFWNYLSKESTIETNPFLSHGGIFGMVLTSLLLREKQPGDTIPQKNLL